MTTSLNFRKQLSNITLSIALFITSGCGEADSSHLRANNYQQVDSLMPTKIWIDAAVDQINNSLHPDSTYQLFLNIDTEIPKVVLEFNTNNELKRAVLEGDRQITNTLYYDKGRLTFSHHEYNSEGDWVIAYANNKPYAAAFNEQGSWKAIEPYVVPLDPDLMRKTKAIAKRYSEIEKAGGHKQRILADHAEIQDEVEKRKSVNYRINVREDEFISVSLKNTSEQVFFTFANQSSSRMEYKDWSGRVDKTGDLIIQVFSAAEIGKKIDFELIVNRQILAELQ